LKTTRSRSPVSPLLGERQDEDRLDDERGLMVWSFDESASPIRPSGTRNRPVASLRNRVISPFVFKSVISWRKAVSDADAVGEVRRQGFT
jgi:hypothetical protein